MDISPEQAFSPAGLAKATLREMGITPPLSRLGEVTNEDLGIAMVGYYGGRAEVRIRAMPHPVRYADVSSMYTTVFSLLDLHRHLVAQKFEVRDITADAREYVERIDRAALHDPAEWPFLAGVYCRVRPADDLLPARMMHSAESGGSTAWTIGVNFVTSAVDLWYTLADVVAAKVGSGRAPQILEARRIAPMGRLSTLRAVELRSQVAVDPLEDDLFRRAIELRHRIRRTDGEVPERDRERVGQLLKTFASCGAYGAFAEYHRLEPVAGGARVSADGLWPLKARVRTPEEPGEFCFPPIASSVTGGGRLLLMLIEADVEARGGTYVAGDTDSLLIVSSHDGGLIPCPGGPARLPDGRQAVRALSWPEVDEVVDEINLLNPYDREAVPSLLKLEPENVGLGGRPEEVYALAISAKRFVLYNRHGDDIQIRKASTHGLGLYRRPFPDPLSWDKRWAAWVEAVWERIIRQAEGLPLDPEPDWFDLPAVGQLSLTTPALLSPFRGVNAGRPFRDQVKPFNFVLVGHVDPLATVPAGVAPDVVPIRPFTTRPDEFLSPGWRAKHDGSPLRVTTKKTGEDGAVRLKTYRDVYLDYRLHPESKSGDPVGGPGRRGSVGLLPRLHVHVRGLPLHIGRESNQLEEVEEGLVSDASDVYAVYRDERAEWAAVVPRLRQIRNDVGALRLARAVGLSERSLRYALNDGKVPRHRARDALIAISAGVQRDTSGREPRTSRMTRASGSETVHTDSPPGNSTSRRPSNRFARRLMLPTTPPKLPPSGNP